MVSRSSPYAQIAAAYQPMTAMTSWHLLISWTVVQGPEQEGMSMCCSHACRLLLMLLPGSAGLRTAARGRCWGRR